MKGRFFVFGLLAISTAISVDSHAQSYQVAAVSGGGTIEGVVVYRGRVPKQKIIPSKDVEVCGTPYDKPLITVGADGAVESAVVYLKEVSAGKDWSTVAPQTPKLDQEHCRFIPEVQAVPAGPLEIINSDPVLHNTHGYYGRRTVFNLALPNKGQVIPTELPRTGTVRVDCDAHGWMEGWIYVMGNPYYAVTQADGTFQIADVPPGDYTLVIEQPYTGAMEQTVSVAAGDTTTLEIELKKQ